MEGYYCCRTEWLRRKVSDKAYLPSSRIVAARDKWRPLVGCVHGDIFSLNHHSVARVGKNSGGVCDGDVVHMYSATNRNIQSGLRIWCSIICLGIGHWAHTSGESKLLGNTLVLSISTTFTHNPCYFILLSQYTSLFALFYKAYMKMENADSWDSGLEKEQILETYSAQLQKSWNTTEVSFGIY